MKKGQIALSALFVSALGLTSIPAPVVCALGVEDGAPIVTEPAAVAKTWEDIIELLEQLDIAKWSDAEVYQTYEEKFVANQAIIDAGFSASNLAKIDKVLQASISNFSTSGSFDHDNFGQVYTLADFFVKGTTGQKLALIARGFELTNDGSHVATAADIVAYIAYAEFVNEQTSGAVAIDFDTLIATEDDVDGTWEDREHWTPETYKAAAILASTNLATTAPVTINANTGVTTTIQEIIDFFLAYDDAKVYQGAVDEQIAYAEDTGKVGLYYSYWALENEIPELDVTDAEAVDDYYGRLETVIKALQIPKKIGEIPEQPDDNLSGDENDKPVETPVNQAEVPTTKKPSVVTPNTGIITSRTTMADAKSNETIMLVASLIAIASIAIVAVARHAHREA